MKNVLIYGSRRPFGQLLAHYFLVYAEAKNMTLNLVSKPYIPESVEELQRDIWDNMVGPATPSRPDLVINCDLGDEVVCDTNAKMAYDLHVKRPAALAIAARAADIPYIQVSSDRVFKGRGLTSDTPKPRSVFGVTLADGERIIQEIWPPDLTHELSGSYILRTSTMYGRQIDNAARQALENKRSKIYASHVPESPTFISDAAHLVARNLLESPQSLKRDNGIVHLAPPDDPISMLQLIQERTDGVEVTTRVPGPVYESYGLVPTKGWVLPKGWSKSWGDFVRSFEADAELRYW